MPHETAARLAEYAHNNVNDALRTIAVIYEDDCEVVYLRDDLKGEYTADEYKAVAGSFRVVPELTADMTSEAPLGSKHCLIHYHEDAFVFQFPHEGCHSILLSVEPTVGSRLRSFINGCQEQL
ncbi:hypothetical protein EGH21_21540 [Halomicroarcula sp. F13]|uniref:Uncharacterized protein n=1 Tax=Haloarcula rubra TaxID=2487747 RepID=A0AAW4PYJ6_9EURY|nr:hypothetical protein [Halomicroarcula rubra]MBX0325610.1 hypothetical protein [Halomicroarcula rubra]